MGKVFKILTAPLWLFKFIWYRFLVFILVAAGLGIYIYTVVKASIKVTHFYPVIFSGWVIQMWTIILIAVLILFVLGLSIAFTISHGRNVYTGGK